MYFILYLYGGAKRPPITTSSIHTAEAAAEAATEVAAAEAAPAAAAPAATAWELR